MMVGMGLHCCYAGCHEDGWTLFKGSLVCRLHLLSFQGRFQQLANEGLLEAARLLEMPREIREALDCTYVQHPTEHTLKEER